MAAQIRQCTFLSFRFKLCLNLQVTGRGQVILLRNHLSLTRGVVRNYASAPNALMIHSEPKK